MTRAPDAPAGVLESALYAEDLARAEAFYGGVLGMERIVAVEGRHVFFRCGEGVVLIFNPKATVEPPSNPAMPVPPHGAHGPGHLCFRASGAEIDRWMQHLEANGVAIEADFRWPNGARSIYFRDPAGNSLEFAEPQIWGLE
jgi:catechol 2,3-dioxygenase-like lactoylglutathione lyase family enzyme